MSAYLPMRFRILHIISENAGITADEIMNHLEPEYGNEGQFRLSVIREHLASMRAVGLIEDRAFSLGKDNSLIQNVQVTDFGTSRLSFLPKSWVPRS